MRWLPWALFAAALTAALSLLVLLLNGGSALTDARSQTTHLRERSELALLVIRRDWIGRQANSVASLSKELEQKGTAVSARDGTLEMGDLVFEVRAGVVADVRYID